ncbi:MAG: hypothetical protein L0Z53_23095, partial [Acidobacteriales bacterium]|nr:hypothetical protein [Terriglobales bacterium]
GDMLVIIGRELGELDEQDLAQLPVHWSVLYEIALLGTAAAKRMVAEGVIHPGLSLREAQKLRPRSARPGRSLIERLIQRLEVRIHSAGREFSQAGRAECAATLKRLAADILIIQT